MNSRVALPFRTRRFLSQTRSSLFLRICEFFLKNQKISLALRQNEMLNINVISITQKGYQESEGRGLLTHLLIGSVKKIIPDSDALRESILFKTTAHLYQTLF